MFPRRITSSAASVVTGTARAYGYQPPGSTTGERRLPWQQSQPSPSSSWRDRPAAGSANVDNSPLLSHVISASTTPSAPAHKESTVASSYMAAPAVNSVVANDVPVVSASANSSRAAQAQQQQQQQQQQLVADNLAASRAAAAGSSSPSSAGGLRSTSPLRMPVLPGPTLDTRIEDIVKTEEAVASEPLPKVVQLLIDPQATDVERITMADFVVMQPKRQLVALGGRKSWLEWLQNSPYYQQVARLATDSPAHDLRALHRAGLHTLYQWTEQPNLVQVSPRTRSALNAAVQHSVVAFMDEVARVVRTSTQHKSLLDRWLADVVGKFVLDALNIRVEAASLAMWEQRGNGLMPSDARAAREGDESITGNGSGASVMSLLLGDESGLPSRSRRKHDSGPSTASSADATSSSSTLLPPGECCTLEHYARFTQKVVSSVRAEAERHAGLSGAASSLGRGGSGGNGAATLRDAQSEMEIAERSNALIATALTQLLETAAQQQLPDALEALKHDGYLALDRVPELLKGALSMLSVRDVPVRFFVLHSTLDSPPPHGPAAASGHSGAHARGAGASLMVPGASFAPGVFLTGAEHMDVTLREWTGAADLSTGGAAATAGPTLANHTSSSTATASASASPASATSAAADAHARRLEQPPQHDDPVVAEYLSVLHRLRRHVMKLSTTSLFEVVQSPELYGGYGFNASEALGMDQLFGAAKLVEDRLASILGYPAATVRKPLHVLEAGYTSGKTAVLERLAAHRVRPGERAVLVRYKSSSAPFVPDLDDHPIAFPSRFWFRAALATCPYFVHTEELFSRAPRSVMWWGNERNWTWSSYQRLIMSASTASAANAGTAPGSLDRLTAVLVDDVDVVLDAMERKWGDDTGDASVASLARLSLSRSATAASMADADERASEEDKNWLDNSPEVGDEAAAMDEGATLADAAAGATAAAAATAARVGRREAQNWAATAQPEADLAAAITADQRRAARARWTAVTGKPFRDVLTTCFGKLTIALGQVNLVLSCHHMSPLLLTHSNGVPCQRYFIPLSCGVGLQQRLRVLPLMATLYAFHLYNGLEFSGVLYEVLKNQPALAGKVLELFWSGRINSLNLRLGAAHALGGHLDGTMPLLRGYALPELFEGLPERNYLVAQPRRERTRLVQLLQRQVCSPTGFLHTGVDTNRRDDRDGIILPHHSTTSQVSPFALFLVFARLEELEGLAGAAAGGADTADLGSASPSASSSAALAGAREKRIVRAWAEVWTQYAYVVGMMATIPERKREAMRVLLQGVLLLRAASVAGVELELNLKVPAYGFPLLATDTGARHGGRHEAHHHNRGAGVAASASSSSSSSMDAGFHPLSAQTVAKAVSAYRSFFASATQSHFSFLPLPGRNGGCDIVMLAGSTVYFYDVVTTVQERAAVTLRFAETLLGMLHILDKQVLPADKVRQLHYVTVVSIDHQSTRPAQVGSVTSHDLARRGQAAAYATTAPYYMDMGSLFDDSVLDHLRLLQEPLGLGKKTFRTLNDLIDELERCFHVRVRHDFCATQEELEALFTPTLLQLVPDATVLPAYQSPIVTAEDLMHKAMFETGGMDLMGDADEDALILDADDEGMIRGAEVEDVHGDAMLARDGSASVQLQRDVLGADSESFHESAALLEVMLNDELDVLTGAAERQKRANAATATDLQHDFAVENSLNYRVESSHASGSGLTGSTMSLASHNTHNAGTPPTAAAAGGGSGEDSLAWLHDILSPDSLATGLRGGNSASATAAGGGAGSVVSPEDGAAAPMLSRFSGSLDATSSTFGLPVVPSSDNWLRQGGRLNNTNQSPVASAALGETAAGRGHGDGDEEADEEGELDLDFDAGEEEATTDTAAAPAGAKKRAARPRTAATAAKTKGKASGRSAGRGQRGRGAEDPNGEVVTLEDLLMQVGRRNAAARRPRTTSKRSSGSAAKKKAASSSSSSAAGRQKASGASSSASKKVKAGAAVAKTRKSTATKTAPAHSNTTAKKSGGKKSSRRAAK